MSPDVTYIIYYVLTKQRPSEMTLMRTTVTADANKHGETMLYYKEFENDVKDLLPQLKGLDVTILKVELL